MKRVSLVPLFLAALIPLGAQAMMSGPSGPTPPPSAMTAPPSTMMAAPQPSATPGAMIAPPSAMMAAPQPSAAPGAMMAPPATLGNKRPFESLASAQALAAKGPLVLFFAASWCPTCQAELKELEAEGSRLGAAIVLVLDYDKNPELKRRYGVTSQHSYVQIDARGERLAIWYGGGVEGILRHLVKDR